MESEDYLHALEKMGKILFFTLFLVHSCCLYLEVQRITPDWSQKPVFLLD
jgi:hypothetical protein